MKNDGKLLSEEFSSTRELNRWLAENVGVEIVHINYAICTIIEPDPRDGSYATSGILIMYKLPD